MFDQCLKILLIFGLFSAVARGEDATSTIASNYNGKLSCPYVLFEPASHECYARIHKCSWKNDPSADQSWSLTSYNGATWLYANFIGSSPRGNSSVRAISPIFSRDDNYGCVRMDLPSFSEPNNGIYGLRVYQKPVHIALSDLMAYSDEAKKDYILFEIWRDQYDNYWNFEKFPLKHFDSNFQIILEGIFGEVPVNMEIHPMELKWTTECTVYSTPYTVSNRQTTSTEQATQANGDTITDEVMTSNTWVDSPPTSPQSNLWPKTIWPTTLPTTKQPTQTRQERNGCVSRNPPIILSLTAPGNSLIDFRVRPPCSAGAASGAITD